MAHQDNPRGFLFGEIMTNEQIKRGTDKNGHYAGYLYLSGCDLKGITLPTTIAGFLEISGDQWASIAFSDLQKFAAPWFAENLVVEDISEKTNWCEYGIREAMGDLGLECDDDATEYDRVEVHTALKRAAKAIGDDEKCAIALAILDRVESGK